MLFGQQLCTALDKFYVCKTLKCFAYYAIYNIANVLQGCYDAGVIYLKQNASLLIGIALVVAFILVCNILFSGIW